MKNTFNKGLILTSLGSLLSGEPKLTSNTPFIVIYYKLISPVYINRFFGKEYIVLE